MHPALETSSVPRARESMLTVVNPEMDPRFRGDDEPGNHAPRLRVMHDTPANLGVTYDSEDYAMLNRPIETGRHARRILRYLKPTGADRLLEIGCGRGWLTQRMQETCPAT